MAVLHGGELVVKSLKREGVEQIFSLSGGHIAPIYDACIDHGMKIYDTRHEQAAAHMAEAWARLTGKPGVAVVTAGPGFTNAVTGIANAWLSGSPMVVISGHSSMRETDTCSLQELDQLPIIGPITKWSRTIHDITRIPEYISMAFRHACSGKPGPVYLEIPTNVIMKKCESEDATFFPPGFPAPRPGVDPDLIRKAVELIEKAEYPVVVAGSGLWYSQAFASLKKWIEFSGLPVFTKAQGRGGIPDSHPLCFGSAVPLVPGAAGTALSSSDLLILLGTRLDMFMNFGRPPVCNLETKLIQIDINPLELGRNRGLELGISGDLESALTALLSAYQKLGKPRDRRAWVDTLREAHTSGREDLKRQGEDSKLPMHPLRLIAEIKKCLEPDSIIAADGGDTQVWTSMAMEVNLPGHYIDTGLFGCLGVGVPFALTAKIVHPKSRVIQICGDGAIGFNLMEFDTAIRHKLPIICVVSNDQAWGMIKHGQELVYGKDRIIGAELGLTRYDKMVEAIGGYGELVRKPEDVAPAINRALASGKPALINVETDPDAVSPGSYALVMAISG